MQPNGLYSPWNSPGQNTGVGSLSFLQGIFPSQGSNAGLPHCRRILYQLSHKGNPILEWVAFPFSKGSHRHRNRTLVSCIAGGFLPTELSGKPSRLSQEAAKLSTTDPSPLGMVHVVLSGLWYSCFPTFIFCPQRKHNKAQPSGAVLLMEPRVRAGQPRPQERVLHCI